MGFKLLVAAAGLAMCTLTSFAAPGENDWSMKILPPKGGSISDLRLAQVRPGASTKVQVRSLLGAPWRVVQFNDCGMAMPGQADETWDYRGRDSKGTYRVHIEFDDHDVAQLVAKIPDHAPGEKGTAARVAPRPTMAMK